MQFEGYSFREYLDVMILVIHKPGGETRFDPAPAEPLAQGDRLLAVGEVHSLRELERKLG